MVETNPSRPFSDRSAFLLNANARGVSDRLVARLSDVVPQGDLFLSRSLSDAETFAQTICDRGYGQVFTGGGDGTVVSTVNLLRQHADANAQTQLPQVGVLKLGTGNAMARALGARDPIRDAHHVVKSGEQQFRKVDIIQTSDGLLTPFAGMGYDGEVLNDYVWLKETAKKAPAWMRPVATRLAESVGGYLGAMLARSVPRHFKLADPTVRITSKSDAYKVVGTPDGDEEILVPAGTLLYEGKAPVVSVGTIPYYGFGFTMFPHSMRKAGHMQLRIAACGIPRILANLYPGVWRGNYRHPELHDFLVRDVDIEADRPLPYQVGGDAAGARQNLRFEVAPRPLEMLTLGERLALTKPSLFGLPKEQANA